MADMLSRHLVQGIVVRATPNAYSYLVKAGEGPTSATYSCTLADSAMSPAYGAKSVTILDEGTGVLVWLPPGGGNTGVIIAALPRSVMGAFTDEQLKANPVLWSMLFPESNATLYSEDGLSQPLFDKRNATRNRLSPFGRTTDGLPGDQGFINAFGLSLGIFGLIAKMAASVDAGIEFNLLNDAVKLMSQHYRHLNAGGEYSITNDEGFITYEFGMSHLQPETAGMDDYEDVTKEQAADRKSKQIAVATDDLQLKPRLQAFVGALGDLFQFFISVPASGKRQWSLSATDFGVFNTHIAADGTLLVRSRSGLHFMLDDRIQVPKRKRQPWDPAGDKDYDPRNFPRTPFVADQTYPWGANLSLRARLEWERHQSLRYFREMKKDWELPSASAQAPLPTNRPVDAKTGATAAAAASKLSGWHFLPDGSVIIRDGWGSEIVMRGGNIIFSAVGDVVNQPGGSAVTIAGRDVIQKAQEHIDLSTAKGDIRLKAETNLHAHSQKGGILLEAVAEGQHHGFAEGTAPTQPTLGIVLKAEKASIAFIGRTVVTTAAQIWHSATDWLIQAAGTWFSRAREFTMVTPEAKSVFSLGATAAILAAETTRLFAKNAGGVLLTEDKVAWQPAARVAMKDPVSPYQQTQDQLTQPAAVYDSVKPTWLGAFAPDLILPIKFRFRDSDSYGTDRSTEVTGEFHVYQTQWQALGSKGPDAYGFALKPWQEEPVNETWPWPGARAMDNEDALVIIGPEEPVPADSQHLDEPADKITLQTTNLRNYQVPDR